MTNRSRGALRRLRNLSVLLAAGSFACGAADETPLGEPEATESIEEPIINGTVVPDSQFLELGLAAVYHRSYRPDGSSFWWPRPCSGVLVRQIGNVTHVLTARHCITRDGETDSPLLEPHEVVVSRLLSPGIANPNPPGSPNGFPATHLTAMPVTTINADSRDMALVRVGVGFVVPDHAIFVSQPANLAGVTATSYGYGINQDLPCGDDPSVTAGAGTARSGGPFAIQGGVLAGQGGKYSFPNSTGKRVTCGDSGGPDLALLGEPQFGTWRHILGVHYSVSPPSAKSVVTNLWLQNTLGAYLSPYSAQNLDVGLAGSGVILDTPTDPDHQILSIRYDPATSRILNGTNCLNGSLLWAACTTSSSQRWAHTNRLKLRNEQTGLCMTHSGNFGIAMQTCSTATTDIARRQMWAWHLQI